MTRNTKQTFSVVIPAWNEADQIEQCINAVKTASAHLPYTGDIIVVDNNSTDNTADIATSAGAQVVFEPFNQIARARNTGAAASDSEWLVFVDADSHVNPVLLGQSLDALAGGNIIGGGSTVVFDRDLKGTAKMMVSFWNWWSVTSNTAAGCFIYTTAEAFKTIGGFDERQYAAEELYFSKKMRKLAVQRQQQFVIQTESPIVSSARKLDWYSPKQKIQQLILLLIPGATRSKNMLAVWYDRSNIKKRS